MMHRQASFFAATAAQYAEFGEGEGQYNYFYFPSNEGQPILTAGLFPGAFRDAPEVWAVMQYLGSPEFANARQVAQAEIAGGLSGYLSANLNADPQRVQRGRTGFHRAAADRARSPSTPPTRCRPRSGRERSGREGTSFVNGDVTAQEAADNIEASWPTS